MNNEKICARVISLIGENLPGGPEPLSPGSRLSESVLLESVMVLEIVMALEEEYGIGVDRADLDFFDTPANIADLVARKLSGVPS